LKLLVTGRSGQLAQSLLEAGSRSHFDVVAVGRPGLDLSRIASIEANIEQMNPSIVVNAAAYTAVDKAESEPEQAHAINARGAGEVAAACERHGIPLIHISTDYVFEGRKAEPYVEDDAVGPTSVYGRSKLEGEQRVAAACSRSIILRTAWVYSPFGHNFVKTMLRLAASRAEIAVVDDQVGCPTYAPHLADAVLAVAERVLAHGRHQGLWGVYHAAGQGQATWCTFAREIFRCSAKLGGPAAEVKAITTADYPTAAGRPANSRLDCSKLARVFGVCLPDWREGTAQCVRRLIAT
jgi:dTDP-4-dehydrorhamnose reductase